MAMSDLFVISRSAIFLSIRSWAYSNGGAALALEVIVEVDASDDGVISPGEVKAVALDRVQVDCSSAERFSKGKAPVWPEEVSLDLTGCRVSAATGVNSWLEGSWIIPGRTAGLTLADMPAE